MVLNAHTPGCKSYAMAIGPGLENLIHFPWAKSRAALGSKTATKARTAHHIKKIAGMKLELNMKMLSRKVALAA